MVMFKNFIEIMMMVICAPMVFIGKVALIFPIMYFQYIRIKFVSNQFQKRAFRNLVDKLKQIIPEAIWDSAIVSWFRGWLWSYVQFDKESDKKNDDASMKDSFRGSQAATQGV